MISRLDTCPKVLSMTSTLKSFIMISTAFNSTRKLQTKNKENIETNTLSTNLRGKGVLNSLCLKQRLNWHRYLAESKHLPSLYTHYTQLRSNLLQEHFLILTVTTSCMLFQLQTQCLDLGAWPFLGRRSTQLRS